MEYCKIHRDDSTLIVAIMNIWETTERGENLEIRIEKMEDMDTYAEFTLPAYHCHHAYGFKETALVLPQPIFTERTLTSR